MDKKSEMLKMLSESAYSLMNIKEKIDYVPTTGSVFVLINNEEYQAIYFSQVLCETLFNELK